jgi:hypothetical protein
MSLLRSCLLLVPALSVVVACGGGIDTSKSEQGIAGSTPPAGSSSGTSPGKPIGGQCKALPTCDAGDDQVPGPSACLQDEARCYERERCGTKIWCTGGGISTCAAYPSCDPGYIEVASCTTKDCVSETMCGATIYCRPDAQCDGYPSCDPGHTKVPSPAQCLQDDAVCYPRSLCGITIWCTGPTAADAGSP